MTSALGSMVVSLSLDDDGYHQGMTKAEFAAQRAARTAEREAARMTAAAKTAQRQLAETAQLSTAMTAKQINAAMRGVPAQLTDIVVSLQGGQAPLTVLLQQGGQLKDMFGGVGVAARALGGYVLSLVNPVSVVATAAAGMAYGFYRASNEAEKVHKTLLMSNGLSGASFNSIAADVESMGEAFGITNGMARDVLNMLASTGVVARTNMKQFGQTSIEASSTFDIALEDIVKNFEKLGKEPVKASIELNKSLGYLTDATLKQIIAADQMGNKEQAAALAQKAYDEAMSARTERMKENAGKWSKYLGDIVKSSKEALGAIAAVFDDDSIDKQIKKAEERSKLAGDFRASRGGESSLQDGTDDAKKRRREDAQETLRLLRVTSDRVVDNRRKEEVAIAKTAKDYAEAESKKKEAASAAKSAAEKIAREAESAAKRAAKNRQDEMEADFQFLANSGLARIKANEDAAKEFEKDTETPLEALQRKEALLKKLQEQGYFKNEATYIRAMTEAQDEFNKKLDESDTGRADKKMQEDAKAMKAKLLEPIEQLAAKEAEISEMRKAGHLDEEMYSRARMQAYDDYIEARDKREKEVNAEAIEQARRLGDAYASTFSQALQGGMKFGDLLKKLAIDTISIQFLTPWAQSAGSSLAKGIGSLFSGKSFAGGGYTGDGSRSGGLDGQGGYLAMLHPQETVVDHAQGQRMSLTSDSGGAVNISQVFNFGNSDASTVAALRAEAGRIKAETLAAVQAKANRGGSFARAVGRA